MGIVQLLKHPRGYERYFRTSSLVLLVALFFGVVFGATMVNYLDFHQQQDLQTGLNYYLQLTDQGGDISRARIAANSLNTNGLSILYITLGGLAVVGLPFIWAFLFFRGMVLGFTIGWLVRELAWKGLAFSLLTLFPFSALLLPIMIFSGAQAMSFSWLIIVKVFGGGDRNPPPILGFLLIQGAAFFGVFLLALLEALAMPWLLGMLIPWVQG